MCLASRSIVAALVVHGLLVFPLPTVARADAAAAPVVRGNSNRAAQGVLLLRNGNVIAGTVHRFGDHYRVVVPGGEVHLQAAEVRLLARDLDDLYRQLSAAVDDGDAGGHLQLAQWCVRERLLGYAAREIISAQKIAPSGPGLRRAQRCLEAAAATPVRIAAPPGRKRRTPSSQRPAPTGKGPSRGAVSTAADTGQQPAPESAQRQHRGQTQGPAATHSPAARTTTGMPGRTHAPQPQPAQFRPKDPFDPEIFNRRFSAPRDGPARP